MSRPSAAVEKKYRTSLKGKATRNRAQAGRRAKNPQPMRDWRLKKYGLSQADYDRLLARQSGVCAICFRDPATGQHKKLRVDHDHQTKLVRGLLCHHCNVALGHFCDCIPILRNAILYLRAAGLSDTGL